MNERSLAIMAVRAIKRMDAAIEMMRELHRLEDSRKDVPQDVAEHILSSISGDALQNEDSEKLGQHLMLHHKAERLFLEAGQGNMNVQEADEETDAAITQLKNKYLHRSLKEAIYEELTERMNLLDALKNR